MLTSTSQPETKSYTLVSTAHFFFGLRANPASEGKQMKTRVAIGLAMFGVGWRALVTLLFNVLVTSSPQYYQLKWARCAVRPRNAPLMWASRYRFSRGRDTETRVLNDVNANPNYFLGEVPDDGFQDWATKRGL